MHKSKMRSVDAIKPESLILMILLNICELNVFIIERHWPVRCAPRSAPRAGTGTLRRGKPGVWNSFVRDTSLLFTLPDR